MMYTMHKMLRCKREIHCMLRTTDHRPGMGWGTVSDYNVKYVNKIQDMEFKCQGIQLKY